MSTRTTQTTEVRRMADLIESSIGRMAEYVEPGRMNVEPDLAEVRAEVAAAVERSRDLAAAAVERSGGGTARCLEHAERARAAARRMSTLAADVFRLADEVERGRADKASAALAMLERDHPILAALVEAVPQWSATMAKRGAALVKAYQYDGVRVTLDRFLAAFTSGCADLPDHPETMVDADTDARALAALIGAYALAADNDTEDATTGAYDSILCGASWDMPEGPDHHRRGQLAAILDAATRAGWAAPGAVFPGVAADLDTMRPGAGGVHGGTDDMDVARAALLASPRFGVFDDVNRPDDHCEPWYATVVAGVPVLSSHVEEWRSSGDYDEETYTLRSVGRAEGDWQDWGEGVYVAGYIEGYAEAILDVEGPRTLADEYDTGVSLADAREAALSRAEREANGMDLPALASLSLDLPLDEDEICALAAEHAVADHRGAMPPTRPEGVDPLL